LEFLGRETGAFLKLGLLLFNLDSGWHFGQQGSYSTIYLTLNFKNQQLPIFQERGTTGGLGRNWFGVWLPSIGG